ncbi:hypothetical protein PTKU46_80700 [Paraburkholderia terrae]|uniref:hypothetical protein n=1 Tax=Paraburkholderia terrae TaxID=311230 RepID=UPI0030DEB72B
MSVRRELALEKPHGYRRDIKVAYLLLAFALPAIILIGDLLGVCTATVGIEDSSVRSSAHCLALR